MSDRREISSEAAGVTLGLAAGGTSAGAAEQPAATLPTSSARALMARFGLDYPIFAAGMAGSASPELAIAVSNAGGLGAIGTGAGLPTDVLRDRIAQIKAGTSRPFAVNYLLAFEPATLPVALDAGAPIVQFAWGIPTAAAAAAIREAGARMGIQIGSPEGARAALDLGADFLICQGVEAGGHVQATSALYDVLPAVLEEAKTVPVLAAGGIANGAQMRRALLAGAAGALLGTRFVATKEARAHDDYKAAITRANSADTVLTVCFQDGWPNAPHRALRNPTFTMWEAAGCPPVGKRPGEGDILTTNVSTDLPKRRYSAASPVDEERGAATDCALFAGVGVDVIRDIPSAGELVARLWQECVAES